VLYTNNVAEVYNEKKKKHERILTNQQKKNH